MSLRCPAQPETKSIRAGGRSPIEVQASGQTGGGRGPRAPTRPARVPSAGTRHGHAGACRKPAPTAATSERARTARRPEKAPVPEPAPERPPSEPASAAGKDPSAPHRPGSRVTHEKFGDGTVVRANEGKTTVAFDNGGERTILSERLCLPIGRRRWRFNRQPAFTVKGTAGPQ